MLRGVFVDRERVRGERAGFPGSPLSVCASELETPAGVVNTSSRAAWLMATMAGWLAVRLTRCPWLLCHCATASMTEVPIPMPW